MRNAPIKESHFPLKVQETVAVIVDQFRQQPRLVVAIKILLALIVNR